MLINPYDRDIEQLRSVFTNTLSDRAKLKTARVDRPKNTANKAFDWSSIVTRTDDVLTSQHEASEQPFDELLEWLRSPSHVKTHSQPLHANTDDQHATLDDVFRRITEAPPVREKPSEQKQDTANPSVSVSLHQFIEFIQSANTPSQHVDPQAFSGLESLMALSLENLERISERQVLQWVETHPSPQHPLTDSIPDDAPEVVHTQQSKLKPPRRKGRIVSRPESVPTEHAKRITELPLDEVIAMATGSDGSTSQRITAKADEIEALNAAEAERIRERIKKRREAKALQASAKPTAKHVLLNQPEQIAQNLDLDISSLVNEIEQRNQRQRHHRNDRDRRDRNHRRW